MECKPDQNEHLTDRAFWADAYQVGQASLKVAPPDDTLWIWIESHLEPVEKKSCLEIGCYPDRYMTVMGDLGYTLHGLTT